MPISYKRDGILEHHKYPVYILYGTSARLPLSDCLNSPYISSLNNKRMLSHI